MMYLRILLSSFLLALEVSSGAMAYSKTKEEVLLHHLFGNQRNYSQFVPNLRERKFTIAMNIIVKGIEDVKSDDNTIGITTKIELEWNSDLLEWNGTKFGINLIAVDASKVWTPKLSLEETIAGRDIAAKPGETVYMNNDGWHKLSILRRIEMQCLGNACLFPKDTYQCSVSLTLERLQANDVNLTVVLKKEADNPATWGITFDQPLKKSEKSFIGDTPLHSQGLHLKATLKRKPFFYMATVILPIFLLNTMSCLSVILPAITGDRIAMLLSCLLAAVIYLETTFKYIPTSSTNFPLIIWLVMITLFTTGLQIVLAGICLNWAHKEERKKKPGKKFIFLMLFLLKLIFWLPYMLYKIKRCIVRKRKMTVTNENGEGQNPPQHIENTNANENTTDEILDTTRKGYRTAIKMVDRLAIILGVIILVVPTLIGYSGFVSTEEEMVWFCEKNFGLYIK